MLRRRIISHSKLVPIYFSGRRCPPDWKHHDDWRFPARHADVSPECQGGVFAAPVDAPMAVAQELHGVEREIRGIPAAVGSGPLGRAPRRPGPTASSATVISPMGYHIHGTPTAATNLSNQSPKFDQDKMASVDVLAAKDSFRHQGGTSGWRPNPQSETTVG